MINGAAGGRQPAQHGGMVCQKPKMAGIGGMRFATTLAIAVPIVHVTRFDARPSATAR